MVDFGSTYTKVTAVDLEKELVLGRAQSPTTIETDINIGLNAALTSLYETCAFSQADICGQYACSSAAGGLKMAAIGLVPDLTLKAAQRAALGAGAKVVSAHGFEIDSEIVREIEEKHCDIVLLCGGTDGGNKHVIVHNAKMLAASDVSCPILVCGNRSAAEEVRRILEDKKKRVYVTKNVLPTVERVDVEPAQALIREVFIAHIVKAKGLDKAQSLFQNDIIPTPRASLNAATLLADGTPDEAGIGSLLVVEVGGATTNIHSVEDVKPATAHTVMRGLPEARVSRTVEGDLGIRYNARTIYDFVGESRLADIVTSLNPSVPADEIDSDLYTRTLNEHVDRIPQNDTEAFLDIALAKAAVNIAVERHAGSLRKEFSVMGEIDIQYGKNFMEVKNIVGTGGIFKYGREPKAVLEAALFSPENPWSLKPQAPRAFIDGDYLFYAMGLLSQAFPNEALRIAKKHLQPAELTLPRIS
jgi:uncharacterized protein (TIGR01319 family)